jgi:hypothetical protein
MLPCLGVAYALTLRFGVCDTAIDFEALQERRMCARVFSLLVILGIWGADVAQADWQYTRWGMRPEEVVAASGGKAEKTTAEEKVAMSSQDAKDEPLLKAPYQSGRYQFIAFFHFDKKSGRLSSVNLELQNTEFGRELLGSLRQKYGKPDSDREDQYLNLVVWRKNGDQTSYIGIVGKSFSVHYQPLNTKDNEGL